MLRRLRLVLAYDGTEFHGWQRQAGVRTVQEVLEDVLRHVLRHPVQVAGASRTDAGVHALRQVAAVTTNVGMPNENLLRAIGHRLPPDVALVHVADAAGGFHPSRDALGKLYRYRIYNSPQRPVSSLCGRYTWHVWYPLDSARLREAAGLFVGRHDFAGFASAGSPRETTVRTIRRVGMRRRGRELAVDVEGDGFLYRQVRNMVGALVEVARGHWPMERLARLLQVGDRSLAGPTAPPQGLHLQWVRYPVARRVTDGSD